MMLLHATPALGRRRGGFTLIELLVVIAIIAVLVSLTVGSVLAVLSSRNEHATGVTIQKVAAELSKRRSAVIAQANNETISSSALQLAGSDSDAQRRARVIHIYLRLQQELPMTYAEILNPALGQKAPYVKALNGRTAANKPETEPGACLYIILTQGGGLNADLEQSLGAGFVKDTDGDGVKEITDTFGKALTFVRFPYANTDLNPNGLESGNHNSLDPQGLLGSPAWFDTTTYPNNAASITWFTNNLHPVQSQMSYRNLESVVSSAGRNGKYEGVTADDIFSYRLR